MSSRTSQSRNRRFSAPTTKPGIPGSAPRLTARMMPDGNLTGEQNSTIKSDLRLILITAAVLVIALVVLSFFLH
jgi:hypothetical protein